MEGIVEGLRSDVAELRAEIRRLEGKIDTNFRWTIGIMITMWVTIMLTIFIRRW